MEILTSIINKYKVLLFVLLIFSVLSCQHQETIHNTHNEYATGFEIEHHQGYQILTVYLSSQDSLSYLVVHRDNPVPNIKYNTLIRTPIHKLIATSTSYIPMLDTLGVTHTLKGFTGIDYISSKKTKTLPITEISTNANGNAAINIEKILDISPEVIMSSQFFLKNNDILTQNNNIVTLINNDWLEKYPLGRAEWIKVFGLLYDMENRADSIFNGIKDNYLTIASDVKKVNIKHPTLISGATYQNTWHVPGKDSWYYRLFEDAGGDYIFKNVEGNSIPMDFERVFASGKNADFWIGTNLFSSYASLLDENKHYQKLKSVQNKKVYGYSHSSNNKGVLFYELSMLRPDLALHDLAAIFYPKLYPHHQLLLYTALE